MSVFKWLKVSRYMKYCMAIGLLGSMTLQAMAQYTGRFSLMRTEMVSSMKVKNDCIGSLFPMG
jgi:hypothetical protein